MTAAAASVNIALGAVYLFFAAVLTTELRRNFASFGHSHLGYAFLALALTCGPHHLAHGLHLAEGAESGVFLDFVAVAVGLPIGAIWVGLRLEAFRGGRGDRFIAGSPAWIVALPTLAGIYVTAYAAAFVARGGLDVLNTGRAATNGALVVTYALIALYLLRTQMANRRPLGGWSVSGLTLSGIFASCVVMHSGHALLVLDGTYSMDIHMTVIDAVSIPAAVYFLWTVEALYRGRLPDWNRVEAAVPAMRVTGAPAVRAAGALPHPSVPAAAPPAGEDDPWARRESATEVAMLASGQKPSATTRQR